MAKVHTLRAQSVVHDQIEGDRDVLHNDDPVMVVFSDGTRVHETVRVIQETHGDAYETDYIYNRTYIMKREGVLVSLLRSGVDVSRDYIRVEEPRQTIVIWEDGLPHDAEPPVPDDFFTNLMGDE